MPTGTVFDLGGRRFTVSRNSRYYSPTPGRHEWDSPGLSWSAGDEVAVRLLVPAITVKVVGGSAFHDGSSLFRVRVRFSKVLQNGAEAVAGAFAAETAGGTISEARCVWRAGGAEREGEEWDIYIKPDGDSDVTLGLVTGGHCDLPGRLCSQDELRVGNWLHDVRSGSWIKSWTGRTIPFLTDGVTATVVGSPNRHDGSSPFDVRVRFGEELHNSYLRIMRAFEGTTGGTVVRTRPVPRHDGTHDGTLWDITVQPDGIGDVTLALKTGGPCRETGPALLEGLEVDHRSARFPLDHIGPPEPDGARGKWSAGICSALPIMDEADREALTLRPPRQILPMNIRFLDTAAFA